MIKLVHKNVHSNVLWARCRRACRPLAVARRISRTLPSFSLKKTRLKKANVLNPAARLETPQDGAIEFCDTTDSGCDGVVKVNCGHALASPVEADGERQGVSRQSRDRVSCAGPFLFRSALEVVGDPSTDLPCLPEQTAVLLIATWLFGVARKISWTLPLLPPRKTRSQWLMF